MPEPVGIFNEIDLFIWRIIDIQLLLTKLLSCQSVPPRRMMECMVGSQAMLLFTSCCVQDLARDIAYYRNVNLYSSLSLSSFSSFHCKFHHLRKKKSIFIFFNSFPAFKFSDFYIHCSFYKLRTIYFFRRIPLQHTTYQNGNNSTSYSSPSTRTQ